ncbi:hypothetical protein A4X09_0g2982 [Tilletia walkeri]|uniref:J domain-containing protein n=1 Tax=Tilletia walkeri TaxID=117179 RepID=A0A8X7NBA0_9BASI|nr:hypothetical protein A4X09_0g2982 [Tilletia walkeri]
MTRIAANLPQHTPELYIAVLAFKSRPSFKLYRSPSNFPLDTTARIMDTPDFYAVLGVSPTASTEEIRDAYKKQSLKCHPDRFPNASAAERERHTARFQALADAYYVLSDPSRRQEYDAVRRSHPSSSSSFGDSAQASANYFRSFFSGGATHGEQPEAEGVFGGVFEELLRPEVHRVGAGLGFIMGNIPGAIGGAVLGNRLGAIRDAKGKSVAEVFVNLSSSQKAEILKALASKVLGSMDNSRH